jgi:hypothetical protein
MKKMLRFIKLYGWIIILIIIVLICIAYFGALSPCCHISPPLPPRCVFNDQVKCEDFQIIGDDGSGHAVVQFKAINKGEVAQFSFMATTDAGTIRDESGNLKEGQTLTTNCTVQPRNGSDIIQKESMEVTCVFNGVLESGYKIKFDIKINSETNGAIYGTAK